jgi:hypothetical protein
MVGGGEVLDYRYETSPIGSGDGNAAHLLYPAEGCRIFLQNTGIYEQKYTVSHHRKQYSYDSPPR